jgi:hypothetical protein
MKRNMTIFCLLVLSATCLLSQQSDFPKLTGPYLGQKPPGTTPEIFAPGVVSSEHQEHSSLAFSPDGKEMWWSRWRLPLDMDNYPQVIMFIRHENGAWGRPKMAPFSVKYRYGGPAFSPDGNRIYFYSRRPLQDGSEMSPDSNIWYVKRSRDGWSRPVKLGPAVNSSGMDATPSLAANGNLYFTSDRVQYDDPTGNMDIFVCEFHDGDFTEAKGLGPAVNTPYARDYCPFIAPDESYIIFGRDSRRFDAEGHAIGGDRILMISFRDKEGTWREAVDMGPLFADTRFPSVSQDGKYLFFTKFTKGGHEDFFWVDAKIIEELRPKK